MSVDTPEWLTEGASVWDQDGQRWLIRSVGPVEVTLQHPDRGTAHRLRKRDLVDWVDADEWSTE